MYNVVKEPKKKEISNKVQHILLTEDNQKKTTITILGLESNEYKTKISGWGLNGGSLRQGTTISALWGTALQNYKPNMHWKHFLKIKKHTA